MLILEKGQKTQGNKVGPAKPAQGKIIMTRDWRNEALKIGWWAWHRVLSLFTGLILMKEAKGVYMSWFQRQILAMYIEHAIKPRRWDRN
jgi:hypothetical protein